MMIDCSRTSRRPVCDEPLLRRSLGALGREMRRHVSEAVDISDCIVAHDPVAIHAIVPDPLQDHPYRHFNLHLSEQGAEATMPSKAEGQMLPGIRPIDVERVRV